MTSIPVFWRNIPSVSPETASVPSPPEFSGRKGLSRRPDLFSLKNTGMPLPALGRRGVISCALVRIYKQIARKLFGFIKSKLQRGMGKERRKADRLPANNTIIVEHEGQIYFYTLRDINGTAFAFLVGHGNDLDVGFTDVRKVSIVVQTSNAEKTAKCKVRLLRVTEDFCAGMDLVVMEYKAASMYSNYLIDKYILRKPMAR